MKAEKRCREQLHTYFDGLGQRIAAWKNGDPDGFGKGTASSRAVSRCEQVQLWPAVRCVTRAALFFSTQPAS
jgi:hypothetical protein